MFLYDIFLGLLCCLVIASKREMLYCVGFSIVRPAGFGLGPSSTTVVPRADVQLTECGDQKIVASVIVDGNYSADLWRKVIHDLKSKGPASWMSSLSDEAATDEVVIRGVGEDEFRGLLMDILIGRVAEQIDTEKRYRLAGRPRLLGDMHELKRCFKPGDGFACEIEFNRAPVPKWRKGDQGWKGLTVEVKRPKFDPEEKFNRAARLLRERFAEINDVGAERGACLGDLMVADISGRVIHPSIQTGAREYSEPLPAELGLEGEDVEVVMDEPRYVSSLVSSLVGIRKGQVRDVLIEFSHKDAENLPLARLIGKRAMLSIRCKELHELKLPALDEVFARRVMLKGQDDRTGKKGAFLPELADQISNACRQEFERAALNERNKAIVKALLQSSDFEVEANLLEDEMKRVFDEKISSQFEQLPDVMRRYDEEFQVFRLAQQKEVETDLKLRIILSHIAATENIRLEDKELDEQFKQYKQFSNHMTTDKNQIPKTEEEQDRFLKARLGMVITEHMVMDHISQHSKMVVLQDQQTEDQKNYAFYQPNAEERHRLTQSGQAV